MKTSRLLFITSFIALISFVSCKQSRKDNIDLDKIDLKVNTIRFDKILLEINQDSLEKEVIEIDKSHGDFFKIFTQGVIGIGLPEDKEFSKYLSSFVSDNMVNEAYKDVQKVFPNTEEIDNSLTNAFKRYTYYFPNKQVPKVYGFVSGFNNSIVIADSILGIGFDRYLGSDSEYYTLLGIPKYIQYNMHPKKIPSDAVKSWLYGEFVFHDSIDNLVNNMIYEGALVYITKKLMPNEPDSLVFGYTPEQIKWCKGNESQMWGHLIEHKLLFNTETFIINQFINNAPFTNGFTNESPGRAAVWIGYKIVSQFMERNKNVTLGELIEITDYQSILTSARYNP